MKSTLKTISLIVALCFLFVCSVCVNPILDVFSESSGTITVVIDAGHGGIDNGVLGVTTGVKESELNLDIAKKLKTNFQSGGISVKLTRSGEGGLYGLATKGFKKRDLKKRKEIIEKSGAVVVISIHINKCPYAYRRGVQFFYKTGSEKSRELAVALQNQFNNLPDNVKKSEALVGDYYILNCSNKISVLAECGFLSNEEDEKLLLKDEYRAEIAYNIYEVTLSFILNNLKI